MINRSFTGAAIFSCNHLLSDAMNKICRKKQKYKFQYDINAILSDLICSRTLQRDALEPVPISFMTYTAHWMSAACDTIQAEVYKNSHFLGQRNDKILYYDCQIIISRSKLEDGSKSMEKERTLAESHHPDGAVHGRGWDPLSPSPSSRK